MDTKFSHNPHVVCIPNPAQSHIKTMLKLAKLLHHKGFYVTFVNTEFNHRRFLKSRGPNSLDGLHDFRFETISDGLPFSDADATQDVVSLIESLGKNTLGPFCRLIEKLNGDENIPNVSCILSDGFMPFTVSAAEEFGIPISMFFTIAACALMGVVQFSVLKEKGMVPLKDESYLTNGYLDTLIEIPNMKDIQLKDLPTFLRTTDPNDIMLDFCIESIEKSSKASQIILHTFDALEQDTLNALSLIYPNIFAIGPLELLLKKIPQDPLASLGYSLWKEDTQCLQWLHYKDSNSVVYVNFGSIAALTRQQFVEFAWGLANSKHAFLWIIRPDLVIGDSAIIPPELMEEIKDRGFITSWCPQEEVLNHSSIGVFLTHCGWGSTIESLSAGKPMICWPFFADQQTNCKFICDEWGVGKEIDSNVKRDEVEKLVRILMEEVEGKKMRKKAMEWKRLAEEATIPLGSSCLNLDNLVSELVCISRR